MARKKGKEEVEAVSRLSSRRPGTTAGRASWLREQSQSTADPFEASQQIKGVKELWKRVEEGGRCKTKRDEGQGAEVL